MAAWMNKAKDLSLPTQRSFILLKNKSLNDFFTRYAIKTIPRYMIVDKEGKIINQDAPRPSDPALKGLLNDLAGK